MGETLRSVVIVGAGMAGARAAETLRAEGFDGRIVLLGHEPVRPYDRVPLSKYYLRGESGPHKLFLHDDGFYGARGIDLLLGAVVTSVDVDARQVELSSGERFDYDALLLATGAQSRRLTVPGAELDGVHYLREVADADRLRDALTGASRIVVVGAGWIGCEVAASARQMGVDVALVDPSPLPMLRALGAELARFYRDLHAERGVEWHLGVGVEALRGGPAVEQVVLTDGTVLQVDAVVAGIGVQPRTALAEAAGIACDNGVVTDERLATKTPGVFAAGDVANVWHPLLGRQLRLEHWSAALEQGPVAARTILGIPAAYDKVPFFFSDQYDVGMEYSGDPDRGDQIVYRGDPATREFIAFWLREGRLAAGMNVNTWNVADTIARLVASGRQVDPALLADPGVDLERLL